MKKGLKIWLITWASVLVVWWAWAWLTKAGVIPNWLWIEALCSCVDCHWKSFYAWDSQQINWKECCEGTYGYTSCIDCKLKEFSLWDMVEIDWRETDVTECCEWTYKIMCENCYNRNMIEVEEDVDYRLLRWHPPINNYAFKPIIYLYPTTETEIHVKLWSPENLSHTYPKYNSEKWRNVIAQPNGNLEDIDTWRKLYALYREWKSDIETKFDEWFVVVWKDIIPFLEEKLAILWLNEREAEEFIVYWLPQMEGNKYNLIRFETKEEQDENMLLNITPIPDTVIRVMMDWKAIDEPIGIPEQKLITPERNGFTVVEWWGSPRN